MADGRVRRGSVLYDAQYLNLHSFRRDGRFVIGDRARRRRPKVVDCLLTNLHQPKTTHMVLTGQFAGVDLLMKAYASEHIQSCKFDMFGDCMLIIQDEG